MVILEELTSRNLNKLAKELGINLRGRNKTQKIEEIENAGIDPKKLEEVYSKYAPRCIICERIGILDAILWQCKKCKGYYCIKCAEKRETNDCYASYVKTYIKCPKEHGYLGSDWM